MRLLTAFLFGETAAH